MASRLKCVSKEFELLDADVVQLRVTCASLELPLIEVAPLGDRLSMVMVVPAVSEPS